MGHLGGPLLEHVPYTRETYYYLLSCQRNDRKPLQTGTKFQVNMFTKPNPFQLDYSEHLKN